MESELTSKVRAALVNAHMTYSVERMDGCLMIENLLLEDVVKVVVDSLQQ